MCNQQDCQQVRDCPERQTCESAQSTEVSALSFTPLARLQAQFEPPAPSNQSEADELRLP